MSSSAEIEQLQKRRVELKSALQSMEAKEKALGDNIRILEERLAVRELEGRVKAKRAFMQQLESKKSDLERRLKEPPKKPEPTPVPKPVPSPMPQRPTPTPENKEKAEKPEKKGPMQVTVKAAPTKDQQPKPSAAPAASQKPGKPEEEKEKQEKKKRRWF